MRKKTRPKKKKITPASQRLPRRAARSPKKKTFIAKIKLLTLSLIWLSVGLGLFMAWFVYDLPKIDEIMTTPRHPSVTVVDRRGEVIATYGDLYGHFMNYQDLPASVLNAVVAIEDRRFYDHSGVDIKGIARALWHNMRSQSVKQGGSTITQQLAKNFLVTKKLYQPSDRSLRRKVQELFMALWLEKKLTKKQILTIYLNRMYFGASTYGVDGAARRYFNKSAKNLNLYESALLAGLLKAPSGFSPLNHPLKAHSRSHIVLQAMIEEGFVTPKQVKDVLARQRQIGEKDQAYGARYFADWVYEELLKLLGSLSQDVVVETTLDLGAQKKSYEVIQKFLGKEGVQKNVSQVATIIMSPTGAVRAMIGGREYAASPFNRAYQAYRQVGSLFKLCVYLAALDSGWQPNALLLDQPLNINGWKPKNYPKVYEGPISLERAFALSKNVPTVRLAQKIGVPKLKQMATHIGLKGPMADDLTLCLGTCSLRLIDLMQAFGTVFADGRQIQPYGIISVKNRDGKVLYLHTPFDKRVIERETAQVMKKLLKASITYGTGTKAWCPAILGGKSGTSQDYRDAWFMGATASAIGGVWLGNDDNSPMKKVTGGNLAAEIWRALVN